MKKNNSFATLLIIYIIIALAFSFLNLTKIPTPTGKASDFATIAVTVNCADLDADGYFDQNQCTQPGATDCNDNSSSVHPGASDVCGNGIDEDCSGSDTTCPAAPAPAPSPSSGGGGGSSTVTELPPPPFIVPEIVLYDDNDLENLFFYKNTSTPRVEGLYASKSPLHYGLFQGEYRSDKLVLLNTFTTDLPFTIEITGEAKDFFIVYEMESFAPRFRKKLIDFTLAVPNSYEARDYSGSIIFRHTKGVLEIPLEIRVIPFEPPFQLQLSPLVIAKGQSGELQYTLSELEQEYDVVLNLRIFDPRTEKTVYESTEVLRFSGAYDGTRNIVVDPSVDTQKYIIQGEAYYTHETGTIILTKGLSTLEIVSPSVVHMIFPGLIALLIVSFLGLAVYQIVARYNRKLHITPRHIHGILHPGDTFTATLEFHNLCGFHLDLGVAISGEITSVISTEVANLALEKDEKVRTHWMFVVHADAQPGKYSGEISLSSKNIKESIEVHLEVKGK